MSSQTTLDTYALKKRKSPSSSLDEVKTPSIKVPQGVCLKVDSLRPLYPNLRAWCQVKGHVRVTRQGRVFVKEKDGSSTLFFYKASEWANPFKVQDWGADKCGPLYEAHLKTLLKDEATKQRFLTLKNATHLGCFCIPGAKCHRDIILKTLKDLLEKEALVPPV